MRHPPAIFLMGPTASGKTDLAMEICEHFPCEIISVDSALVYKGMDIGTAKPSEEELLKTPHRLIDLCDPAESYSAAQFRSDALKEMALITASGKIPLLVGGTMLYFKTLLEGMADLPPADPIIRQDIEQQAALHGWPFVHQQLAEVDPASAARIHPNHSQRIERALEVYRLTGRTMTELYAEQLREQAPPYRISQIAIAPADRSVLHQRIASRFLGMMEQGFIDEVRGLYQRGDLNPDMPSMRAVGYRQVWDYLEGKLDYDELIERGIIATRQLAKRQLTWLRNWVNLQWIHTDEQNRVVKSEVEGRAGQSPYQLAKEFLAI